MIGHECTLPQTNAYGWVPLCECGWIGAVAPAVTTAARQSRRAREVAERAQSIAMDGHRKHLVDVTAEIEATSMRVLESIPRLIDASNKTLQRRGRWGHP